MPPAARIGDLHVCPLVNPGPAPHVGGPVTVGYPSVMIGFMPAARVGDAAVCVGPPDAIAKGSTTVMVGFMPVARIGDPTTHGGVVSTGCPTVIVGDFGPGGGPVAAAFKNAASSGSALVCKGPCAACGQI